MGMRLRRQDPVVPGTPAAPAAQPTRGSSIARTLRTAWWPRVLVAGRATGKGPMIVTRTQSVVVPGRWEPRWEPHG
jgi:hypothetical protein